MPNIESVVVVTIRNEVGPSTHPYVPLEMFNQAMSRIVELEFDMIWLKNQLAACFSQSNIFYYWQKGEEEWEKWGG